MKRMKTYSVACESVGVTCVVRASSVARARYTCWEAARRAGYRVEFGDLDVNPAGESLGGADYVSRSDQREGLAA